MTGQRIIRVEDIMVPTVFSVDGLATVSEAIATMKRHSVSSLLVDRRAGDDELGLITVSDIAREVIAKNRPPDRVNVYEVMSKPVLTVRAHMQTRYAVRLLVNFHVSRTLVVDEEGNPLGIATLRDMVIGQIGG